MNTLELYGDGGVADDGFLYHEGKSPFEVAQERYAAFAIVQANKPCISVRLGIRYLKVFGLQAHRKGGDPPPQVYFIELP